MHILQQLGCSKWYKNLSVQLPPHSGSPRLARHVWVLGSGTTIKRNSTPVAFVEDLTWSDNDNPFLGPVLVGQQVLDLSPQHDHPWGKERGAQPQ